MIEVIWLQLGDDDVPAFYDNLDDLAFALDWCGLAGHVIHDVGYYQAEIPAVGYGTRNRIMIYWGDWEQRYIRPVSDAEFDTLRLSLNACGV